DVDVAEGVDGHVGGFIELAGFRARSAPLVVIGIDAEGRLELLDPVGFRDAAAVVGDVDVAGGIDGDTEWEAEFTVARARGTELGDEDPARVELVDVVVVDVGDVDLSLGVSGDPPWIVKFGLARAEASPFREE